MSSKSKGHPTKEELIAYIKMDLFVDDMIRIERHLEECDACRKKVENLRSTPNRKPSLKLILSLLVITGIGSYFLVNFLFNDKKVEVEDIQPNNDLVNNDSLSRDIVIVSEFVEDSVVKDEEIIVDESQEVTVDEQKTIPDPVTKEVISEQSESKQNSFKTAPLVSKQESKKIEPKEEKPQKSKLIKEEPNKIQPQEEVSKVEEEVQRTQPNSVIKKKEEAKKVVEYKLVASSQSSESPSPVSGFSKYADEILTRLKNKKVLLEDGNAQFAEVSLEVSDDGNPNHVGLRNSSDAVFGNAVLEAVKNGSKWKTYISPEYVEYNQAVIRFDLTLKQ
ncbi:anti-sigma factor family protein [Reichenbachiella versicolor]|uniref:anti-sigma factor family protein n=1 Tax=Reichenbachiella versicolor TaxID=1821036 RepID=UPI000D6E1E57|nr:hypothetical protein [Reichenbachiella versicolor]